MLLRGGCNMDERVRTFAFKRQDLVSMISGVLLSHNNVIKRIKGGGGLAYHRGFIEALQAVARVLDIKWSEVDGGSHTDKG